MKKIVKAVEKRKQEFGGVGGFGLAGKGRGSLNFEMPRIELQADALRKNRVLAGDQMESATMAYNMLRTQVYKQMLANGWTTLAVTSSNKSEGKSLTSLNLALSLSRSVQQTVILVDMDMRRPSIHKKLNIAPSVGISDFYTANAPLKEIMFRPEHSDLVVIPGRESLDNASELLGSPATGSLLSQLKRLFPSRLIVLDMPPVLLVDDVMVMSDYIDCSLMVVSEGSSKKEELKQTLELLSANNVIGTVLNNSTSNVSGGGYEYYYGNNYSND